MAEIRTVSAQEAQRLAAEMGWPGHKAASFAESNVFFVAFEEATPVGMALLHRMADEPNLHLEFLEVAEAQRHHGVATQLLESIYAQAKSEGRAVTTNGFTDDGRHYLTHIMNKLGRERGVATEVIGRC